MCVYGHVCVHACNFVWVHISMQVHACMSVCVCVRECVGVLVCARECAKKWLKYGFQLLICAPLLMT